MKKNFILISIITAFVFLFTLTSCAKSKKTNTTTTGVEPTTTVTPTITVTPTSTVTPTETQTTPISTTTNVITTTVNDVFYDISFVDDNDNELTTLKVKEGQMPVYNEIPAKEEDDTYTYEFTGWDSELVKAEADKTYKATFKAVFKEYTISFIDDNNNEISSAKYHFGDDITVPENPTKANTEQYKYTFDGWYTSLTGGTKVGKLSGNTSFYAQFKSDINTYTIIWKIDTREETESYKFGDTPAYKGDTPTKSSTVYYTYEFMGWSPTVAVVTNDATYEAQFNEEDRYYTYKFCLNYACTEVYETGKVKYNTLISVPSVKPTKDPDNLYEYKFSDWYEKSSGKSVSTYSSLLRIKANTSYYCAWQKTNTSFTMTFYTDTTTVYQTIKKQWGQSVTLPTNPTKTGATFMGWSPDVPSTMPSENTSYYAIWSTSSNKLTVTNNASNVTYSGVTSGSSYQSGTNITISITSKPTVCTIKWDVNGTSYVGDSVTFVMPTVAVNVTITSLPINVISDKKVQMGMYPQTLVIKSTLKSSLRSVSHISASSQPDMNYWKSFGETTNPGTEINNYYIDVTYNGDKYRCVYLSNYRPDDMGFNTWSQNDSHQDDNGYTLGNYYWFKYEPITWTICLTDEGKQYMYSDMILDTYYYNKALDNTVQYYKSGLYSYMQNDFSKFFTTEELSLLVNITSGGASAKIVIPAMETVTGAHTSPNIVKKAQATDYAKCRGIYVESGYSEWWTTSSANSTNYVKIVDVYGDTTSKNAINELAGVRPFIAFDISKITL